MPRYASKWLHTLLSPRECSATVQRSDWRVTPTLHPSSLWQYSLIISDPPHSGESLASWVLLCLSLSLFFFFDWSILARNPFSYDHMSQCVHYSWRAISAGRLHHPVWKEKTKREARNPFSECCSVVWCYMRLNLFKYGLVCLMMSLCASPLPPLFPSVCSSKRFFVVIVTPFFLFFLYFCHHSKTATE